MVIPFGSGRKNTQGEEERKEVSDFSAWLVGSVFHCLVIMILKVGFFE